MADVVSEDQLRIVVCGLITQHPRLPGMTWHHAHYLAGLKDLGHDVFYLEDSGQWPYVLDGGPKEEDWLATDCQENVRHLDTTLERIGLTGRWAYRFPRSGEWFGMTTSRRREILQSADLLVNVSGSLENPGSYRLGPRLAYVDTDPVFTQIRLDVDTDFANQVDTHDVLFTFGERLPATFNVGGRTWLPTRQPIIIREWAGTQPTRASFTTVMNWTSYKPLLYRGQTYGQKDVEFMRFIDLPGRVRPVPMEVALPPLQHPEWEQGGVPGSSLSMTRLRSNGWAVVDSLRHCATIDSYRSYIQDSRAEWSVAKQGYVRGQAGWFSERSACYLAAGRPVVTQDTGLAAVLPCGDGIRVFTSEEEAADAVREVDGNYEHHAAAAAAIAHEYFDSSKVLRTLLESALGRPSRSELP